MSDESHFVPEHLEQAAYMHARGRSWALIANEIKYPDADRLRRALNKDAAFKALLDDARAELAEESLAESISVFRAQIREADTANALEAAKALMEFGERHKARQHARAIEEFKAAERARLQKERLDRLAELQREKIAAQLKLEELRAATRKACVPGTKSERERQRELKSRLEMEEEFHAAGQRSTERMASERARKEEVVWMWGGKHEIGYGQEPDMTDIPFRLASDGGNGRTWYWLLDSPHPQFLPNSYQFLTNPDGTPTGVEPLD